MYLGKTKNAEGNLEYNKSCDIGENLDYKNCKYRKKLVDKLVQECTQNVEEVKLAKITSAEEEYMHKCSSCRLYIVLFWMIFTINIGIGTYFVFCKYALDENFFFGTTVYWVEL